MKKYIYIISTIIFLSSCDKIDNPYPEFNGSGSEVAFTSVSETDAISTPVPKKILIEDYTGFKCTNCPAAHEVAEEILEEHGDMVAVLANHVSTSFAAPNFGSVYPEDEFSTDFRTEAGEIYLSTFGIQALPTGVINRTKNGEFFEVSFDDWATKVDALLDEESDVYIDISSTTFENDTIDLEMSFEFLNDIEGNYYFTLNLVEDGVISTQKDGGETIDEYEQNNVFRGALNGTWGEHLKENPNERDKAYIQGRYSLPPLFNFIDEANPQIDIDRCRILVYIYKSDSDNEIFDVVQLEEGSIE